jgi:hypothetical protein
LVVDLLRECAGAGITVVFSAAAAVGPLADVLAHAVNHEGLVAPPVFPDLDGALEFAEGRVLARHSSGRVDAAVSLGDIEVCAGLSVDDIAALGDVLEPISFASDDIMARPGDASFSAWLILEGFVTVSAAGADGNPGARLRTVGPGSILGEMALLSHAPRSAWVRAQTDVRALELSPEGLSKFTESCPAGAVTLLRNIASMLGRWLRDADRKPDDQLVLPALTATPVPVS